MAGGSGDEVEGIVAVEVDVLVGERGDVLDLAGGDQLAGSQQLVDDALDVDGVPSDDRVDDDRRAELERRLADTEKRAASAERARDAAIEAVEEAARGRRPRRDSGDS